MWKNARGPVTIFWEERWKYVEKFSEKCIYVKYKSTEIEKKKNMQQLDRIFSQLVPQQRLVHTALMGF